LESRHGEDTREHALIVAVEDTTNAGERRDPEDLEVLPQRGWPALAHQGLALVKGGIIDARHAGVGSTHVSLMSKLGWGDTKIEGVQDARDMPRPQGIVYGIEHSRKKGAKGDVTRRGENVDERFVLTVHPRAQGTPSSIKSRRSNPARTLSRTLRSDCSVP